MPKLKENERFDPMYWKNKLNVCKTLSPTAIWILSIPVTSARSEETFSCNGWTINKRCQLSPRMVNMSLVVKSLKE